MRPSPFFLRLGAVSLLAIWIALGGLPLAAADFPPITAQERQLTAVDWQPDVPAVALSREGILRLWGAQGTQQSSILTVRVRLKVLTEAGKEQLGKVEIVHSRFLRLKDFRGRTVLPDGRELPLSQDSIFRRRSSRSQRLYVTSAAFPGVEVGAILDYRYEVAFDSIFHLDPWEFQTTIPALRSQITYYVPRDLEVQTWQRDPMGVGVQSEIGRDAGDHIVKVWAERVPALPDEPYSFPTSDLAAKFMLVPIKLSGSPLLASWRDTCELIRSLYYDSAERKSGSAKQEAKRLVSGIDKKAERRRAEAIYRFVRDEIETVPLIGVVLSKDQTLNKVIEERKGAYADKGLLLATMLRAVKIEADVVWAASRREGMVDLQVPNPLWFDRTLVRTRVGGEEVYLDPTSRGRAFAALSADFEGTQALVYSTRKPEVVTLPAASWQENLRRAELALELDDEGRLSGTGKLSMSGHSAAIRLARSGDPVERWQEWLGEQMGSYEISEVAVDEAVDEGRLDIRWRLVQRLEEVLGDEVSVSLSRPLGPVAQRFALPLNKRRTPVMLSFGNLSEVEMTLAWPQGWEVDLFPAGVELDNQAGGYRLAVEVDEEQRSLHVLRRMEVRSNQYMGPQDYAHLRQLWGQATKSDAQELVLVRR